SASTAILFFQAEDGIRGRNVTGVQTCALPIFIPNKTQQKLLVELSQRVEELWKFALQRLHIAEDQSKRDINYFGREDDSTATVRSEERRVGKEGGDGWEGEE